jgi:hypothetical protein
MVQLVFWATETNQPISYQKLNPGSAAKLQHFQERFRPFTRTIAEMVSYGRRAK